MGIFSGLFRSRDKPQDRTTGSGYAFYFGSTTSGKAVTERSAMQMTAVYSCVRILAEAVAGLPLHLYRYKEDGGKEKALDHPLYLLLHDEPNPEMSSFVFRETLMTHPVSYTHLDVYKRQEVLDDRVAFPWFAQVDADSSAAYTHFISALCEMSRNAKRVTATEKPVENEKYAFRCFLLRLGFIGSEYKAERKILLKNLTGSSAFKNGGVGHEVSE